MAYRARVCQQEDCDVAIQWFYKSAVAGHSGAQNNLGVLYEKGSGLTIVQDQETAVMWYGRAAKQGHPYGMFNLATCYAHARGVKQDHVLAYKWLSAASESGHQDAQEVLVRIPQYVQEDMRQQLASRRAEDVELEELTPASRNHPFISPLSSDDGSVPRSSGRNFSSASSEKMESAKPVKRSVLPPKPTLPAVPANVPRYLDISAPTSHPNSKFRERPRNPFGDSGLERTTSVPTSTSSSGDQPLRRGSHEVSRENAPLESGHVSNGNGHLSSSNPFSNPFISMPDVGNRPTLPHEKMVKFESTSVQQPDVRADANPSSASVDSTPAPVDDSNQDFAWGEEEEDDDDAVEIPVREFRIPAVASVKAKTEDGGKKADATSDALELLGLM